MASAIIPRREAGLSEARIELAPSGSCFSFFHGLRNDFRAFEAGNQFQKLTPVARKTIQPGANEYLYRPRFAHLQCPIKARPRLPAAVSTAIIFDRSSIGVIASPEVTQAGFFLARYFSFICDGSAQVIRGSSG